MENDPQRIESTVRERILERFAAWLDATLAAEEPPVGVAAEILNEFDDQSRRGFETPEPGPDSRAQAGPGTVPGVEDAGARGDVDLYTLWSSLTALAQEIKLQGRSFKQLHDGLSPWPERIDQVLAVTRGLSDEVVAAGEAREAAAIRQVEQGLRHEQLELLLDLRDRLARGVETACRHRATAEELLRPGLFGRFNKRRRATGELLEAVEAVESGCALSLGRLDDALRQGGVEEMACCGRPFDPARMKAVDLREAGDVAAGTVLEVYRRGYELNGEVLRPAEVAVARAPRAPLEERGR